MAKKYDAVAIGGGHNGPVNAAYLAKPGSGPGAGAPASWGGHPTEETCLGLVLGVQLRGLAASARDRSVSSSWLKHSLEILSRTARSPRSKTTTCGA